MNYLFSHIFNASLTQLLTHTPSLPDYGWPYYALKNAYYALTIAKNQAYYAQNYASIIGASVSLMDSVKLNGKLAKLGRYAYNFDMKTVLKY